MVARLKLTCALKLRLFQYVLGRLLRLHFVNVCEGNGSNFVSMVIPQSVSGQPGYILDTSSGSIIPRPSVHPPGLIELRSAQKADDSRSSNSDVMDKPILATLVDCIKKPWSLHRTSP